MRSSKEKRPAKNKQASTADRSELEAFVVEMGHLDDSDMQRLNVQIDAASDPALTGHHRLDQIGAALDVARARWAQDGADPAGGVIVPSWQEASSPFDDGPNYKHIQVFGFAMRDADIVDGDWVVVDTAADPADGSIVLAEIFGVGMVLRRLKMIGGVFVFKPAHPDFPPIAIDDSSRVCFHGVVPEPIRKIR